MRDDRERLLDIFEAIERIEKYTGRGRSVFDEDELIQTWVLHHLQIIGEAVRALSPETTSKSDEIEWSKKDRWNEKYPRSQLFQHRYRYCLGRDRKRTAESKIHDQLLSGRTSGVLIY